MYNIFYFDLFDFAFSLQAHCLYIQTNLFIIFDYFVAALKDNIKSKDTMYTEEDILRAI